MAFDITNKVVRSPFEYIGGAERKEVTDATGNTAAQDWSTPRMYHRAYVVLSTITPGDVNTLATLTLEVSDVSNFVSNVDVLDCKVIPADAAIANNKPAFTLAGSTPLVAGKRFSRIRATLGTNFAINADVIFEAA